MRGVEEHLSRLLVGFCHTGRVRILVVEDEVELAASIQRGLAAEAFDVDLASDGETGLWMATERTYDAILLDIMLPELNGYQVCARLREAGNWTPVLMLTAKHGEWDEAEALDTGADDFLRKPFSYVVLVARLRAAIRRGAKPRPAVLEVGDLRLDPATRTCRRADAEVVLTAREFAMLELLMRRSPEVVPGSEILDHVWGFDFAGDPNILPVYVGYLRKKVDQPFGRHTIQTVRGAGYRIMGQDA